MNRAIFKSVNLGEKVINDSSLFFFAFSCSSSFSPSFFSYFLTLCLHHLELLVNAKNVKVGINTTEGCAMMVLSKLVLRLLLCQQEATPSKKPGRKMVVRIVAITSRVCSAGTPNPNGEARAKPFPATERTQAAKMSRNL